MDNITTQLIQHILKKEIEKRVQSITIKEIAPLLSSLSLEILQEIQKILQDNFDCDDFVIVEKIVCLFQKYNLDFGSCHDFG